MKLVASLSIVLVSGGSAVALRAGQAAPGREALVSAARDIMTSARYCSLVTLDAAGRPQARIIDAFPPEPDMSVWFATIPGSRKVSEMRRDDRVTLTWFDTRAPEDGYVTLLGRARLVDGAAEKRTRWKPGWEAFWPDRDANYLLVEVRPERLEVVSPKRGIEGDTVTWRPPFVEFPPK